MSTQAASRSQQWLKYWNTFTRWILHSRLLHRLADGQICELRFAGSHTGRPIVLPVMYAQAGDTIVVLVGDPQHKWWWRSFAQPHPVQVWLRGAARTGNGHVVEHQAAGRADAARIYLTKFPDLPVRDDPLVVITLSPTAPSAPAVDEVPAP